MSGSILLDTNVIIALFAFEETLVRRISGESDVFVPSVALGELYYGARKSARTDENLLRLRELQESVVVLSVNAATAEVYGKLKHTLRVKGKPLPDNDIWITAIAIQHRLTLVSRDDHFREIDGIDLQSW